MSPIKLKQGVKTLDRVSNLLKSQYQGGIRNSMKNVKCGIRNTLGGTNKVSKSSIR